VSVIRSSTPDHPLPTAPRSDTPLPQLHKLSSSHSDPPSRSHESSPQCPPTPQPLESSTQCTSTPPPQPSVEPDEPLADIWKQIDAEMSRFNLSQETFACVAMAKTQATLSEMLKRREKKLPETKASANTLRHCSKFLRLPEVERKRKYALFNLGDKTSYMLSREYAGTDVVDVETKIKRVKKSHVSSRLNAVSIGVLKEYSANFGKKPDADCLTVLSEVLGLPKKPISDWFERECKKGSKIG